jgi:effector-binding domain-containing protein
MDLSIERRELESERLLTIELTTTDERFEADLSAAFGRVGETLTEADAVFAGPGICARPKRKSPAGRITLIVGIPFEGELEPGPGMKIMDLKGGSALVGTLHGSYEQLPDAWMEMNGSLAKSERPRPKTVPYDRFLRSMVNVVNSDELITELVIPLA